MQERGGLEFDPQSGANIPPDMEEDELGEVMGAKMDAAPPPKPGWVPLEPVAVTPVLELKAAFLAEKTGWDGWLYTEKQMASIERLIENCGLAAPAWLQLIGAIGLLDAAKYGEYRIWKAGGSVEKEKAE